MTPRIICEVCMKEVDPVEAYEPLQETGHNSWTVEPPEYEEDTSDKMARS